MAAKKTSSTSKNLKLMDKVQIMSQNILICRLFMKEIAVSWKFTKYRRKFTGAKSQFSKFFYGFLSRHTPVIH